MWIWLVTANRSVRVSAEETGRKAMPSKYDPEVSTSVPSIANIISPRMANLLAERILLLMGSIFICVSALIAAAEQLAIWMVYGCGRTDLEDAVLGMA